MAENKIVFSFETTEQIKVAAEFIAQLTREGLTFKATTVHTSHAGGTWVRIEITLTGGY